jgi:hypothetical protein
LKRIQTSLGSEPRHGRAVGIFPNVIALFLSLGQPTRNLWGT